jgi:putative tricarboxylic transport membrane protein
MDIINGILHGFGVALTPWNLLWCLAGVFLGTVVGVLPGLGSAATVALLLPLTLNMDPTGGIIMLAGIYYGAKYGGSTTAILLNLPGETASVATCIDGYAMARKGRAGPALSIAAISSFIAGTFGVLALMLVAPPLARFALKFSAPEYFAIMCLGLSMVVLLAGKSIVKALLSLFLGLWISSIGFDLFSTTPRFTFGRVEMFDGVGLLVVAIGVFAIGEVLGTMEQIEEPQMLPVPKGMRNMLPSKQDMLDCRFAFLNGSVVGALAGLLPGLGSSIASFMSYGIEKAVSKHPEKFGTGVPEGVAAPEGANNSETVTSMVPLLTMGLPSSSTAAIMLAAFVLWNVQPGPLLIQDYPDIFWGLVASMYIGNVMLLVLNIPLIPLFAQILKVPAFILFPLIFGVSIIGIYSDSGSNFDICLLMGFGLLGYLMAKLDYPTAPLILGVVLGIGLERSLRQSILMSHGDILSTFLHRPIAMTALALAVLVLCLPLLRRFKLWKSVAVELKEE